MFSRRYVVITVFAEVMGEGFDQMFPPLYPWNARNIFLSRYLMM